MILLACVFAAGTCLLLLYLKDGRENEKTVGAMLEIVEREAPKPGMEGEDGQEAYRELFAALREINPEVTAWLILEDPGISCPVVKGADNEKYLRVGADGKRNGHGAIFMDYRNDAFKDFNTVIYGHNMKDGTMFGTLPDAGSALLEAESGILTLNEQGLLRWKIISAREISVDKEMNLYSIQYNEEEQQAAVKTQGKQQDAITREDKLLTLSTCADRINDKYGYRYVIQARLQPEKESGL
jgi:sortase B